jgi:sec-independent protein translocase protein TatA
MLSDLFQPTHLLVIAVIALLVFGPKRLPEVGRALGRGTRELRDGLSGEKPGKHGQEPPAGDVSHPARTD